MPRWYWREGKQNRLWPWPLVIDQEKVREMVSLLIGLQHFDFGHWSPNRLRFCRKREGLPIEIWPKRVFLFSFPFFGEGGKGNKTKHCQRHYGPRCWLLYPFVWFGLADLVWEVWLSKSSIEDRCVSKTLPKALRTQVLTALTINFVLVCLVQYAW